MDGLERQQSYWETTGATKTFTHPVHREWLAAVSSTSRVLDYGCGYGRTMAELEDLGFGRVRGADISSALITRGRRARPHLRFELIESPPKLNHPAASFDMVTLFAVLTCVPDDRAQRELVTELHRLLAPGGVLYLSELTVQPDERSRRRYDTHAERAGTPYGVFITDDGAACRHHDVAHLRRLLTDFHITDERHIEVFTMNGNPAEAVQILARRREISHPA
ncbi:class I SAM-dependent methyltransferase [Actinoplanes sp. HUAS TT8]|uniref:class I SAM-dependent methyltransferase n=1 Tax=Actinoplanes sp. HUAS TT8 TaxID=3447453 RepID=UPI003F51DAEF